MSNYPFLGSGGSKPLESGAGFRGVSPDAEARMGSGLGSGGSMVFGNAMGSFMKNSGAQGSNASGFGDQSWSTSLPPSGASGRGSSQGLLRPQPSHAGSMMIGSGSSGVSTTKFASPRSSSPPALDSSDFPSLLNGSRAGLGDPSSDLSSSGTMNGFQNGFYGDIYATYRSKQESTSTEFTISSEDFPALGGASLGHSSSLSNERREALDAMKGRFGVGDSLGGQRLNGREASQESGLGRGATESNSSNLYESRFSSIAKIPQRKPPTSGETVAPVESLNSSSQFAQRSVSPSPREVKSPKPLSQGSSLGVIGSGSTKSIGSELYGLKGLLKVMHPPSDATDTVLARGVDLTMLGLNLNSQEPLYASFVSPWSDKPTRPKEGVQPEYKLPSCYSMQPPPLRTAHFSKLLLESLFYIFYNMPRDVLQLHAALELYNREWRYHKDLKLWFTRAPGVNAGFERGAYIFFDISSWERRPFHDANRTFVQGFLNEDEIRSAGRSQLPLLSE